MVINGARDHDFAQVLKESFDPNQDRIRVDAVVTDGIDMLVINPDGSINVVVTGGTVTISEVTTPTIANITIAVANTEQSYALPVGTKRFKIKARGNAKIQIAYILGDSSSNFISVFAGSSYNEENLGAGQVLYFQANKTGEIIELISWA